MNNHKENKIAKLEIELLKTEIKDNKTIRTWNEYKVVYRLIEDEEIEISRKFIRQYKDEIDFKKTIPKVCGNRGIYHKPNNIYC